MSDGTEGGKISLADLKIAIDKASPRERKELLASLGATESGSLISPQATKNAIEYEKVLRSTAASMGDLETAAKAHQKILADDLLTAMMDSIATTKDLTKNSTEYNKELEKTKKLIEEIKAGETGAVEKMDEILGEGEGKKYEEGFKHTKLMSEAMRDYGHEARVAGNAIGALFGIQDKYSNSLLGSLNKLTKAQAKGGEEALKAAVALQAQWKKMTNIGNLGLNLFSKLKDINIKGFTAFDEAQASLAKLTGQGDKFRATLYETGRQGNLFGISMQDASGAIATLVDKTSNFTSMSKAQRDSVSLTVAKMEKLGVSTADSAAIFQNFNQVLGMTADESIKIQTDLAMAGVSIGISSSKITKDFNSSLSTLMVYGRGSIDVFKGIAAAAKAAGVETSTLLGIASKFDTFAGAAEGASKLNSLLGTQLSTTEMLLATEDERIRMIIESVQSQGIAFQDMDRFTQRSIAASIGVTDMAEANKVFGMSLEVYDENRKKLNASAMAQEQLDEAVSKTMNLQNKLTALGAEMITALQPTFEYIEEIVDSLTGWLGTLTTGEKEFLGGVIIGLAGLAALAPIFMAGGAFLGGLMSLASVILPSMGATAPIAATGIAEIGAASAAAAGPVGVFGLALGTIGIQVIGVIASIAFLVAAVAGIGVGIGAALAPVAWVIVTLLQEFSTMVMGIITPLGEAFSSMFGTDEMEVKLEEMKARSIEALAQITTSLGSDDSVVTRTKAMVDEISKLGQDIKVSSTIENLALVTAGKAVSITGERVSASKTNIVSNVQNSFENMKVMVQIGSEEFEGYVYQLIDDQGGSKS